MVDRGGEYFLVVDSGGLRVARRLGYGEGEQRMVLVDRVS
jgi:hypothetical protein